MWVGRKSGEACQAGKIWRVTATAQPASSLCCCCCLPRLPFVLLPPHLLPLSQNALMGRLRKLVPPHGAGVARQPGSLAEWRRRGAAIPALPKFPRRWQHTLHQCPTRSGWDCLCSLRLFFHVVNATLRSVDRACCRYSVITL